MGRGRPAQPGRSQAILDATLRLIAREGMTAVSYRNVAKESSVPVGSLTFYFPNRDELVYQAFVSFVAASHQEQKDSWHDSERPVVDRLVSLVLDQDDARDYRILLAELYVLSYRDDRYAQLTKQWMEQARTELEAILPVGDARIVDALQEGLIQQRFFAPHELDQPTIRRAFEQILNAHAGA